MKRFILVLISLLMTVTCIPCVAANSQSLTIDDNSWKGIYYTNLQRAQYSIPPLTTFSSLYEASRIRAKELTEVFDHTRPDGRSCFTVLTDNNISYSYAGENAAMGNSLSDPASVVDLWMNSPGHRYNMLSSSFAHIGIGYAQASSQHHWIQLFISGTGYSNVGAVPFSTRQYYIGTSLDTIERDCSMAIYAVTNDGTLTYMPLMARFCTGFEPWKRGKQTVNINVFGLKGTMEIELAPGDANHDGTLNTADAVNILKYCAGMISYNSNAKLAADMNGDGKINTADAVSILNICAE